MEQLVIFAGVIYLLVAVKIIIVGLKTNQTICARKSIKRENTLICTVQTQGYFTNTKPSVTKKTLDT